MTTTKDSKTVTCRGCGYEWILPAHAVTGNDLCSLCVDRGVVAMPLLDLSDNGGIFCGYVDGTVPTAVDCARAGCNICAGELDLAGDDSWMEV